MLTCPEGYKPYEEQCPYCGSTFFDYRRNGPHMEVWCVGCDRHITYIPKLDIDIWKKSVKERDLYTCQRCGAILTPRTAHAHHKLPVWFMPKLQFNTDNGITLCKQCHKQIHGVGGTIKEMEDLTNEED